ncbi:twin-arginine translocase TatA/TatE family subunit [Pullulanibacillus sp. KACC 23026]|uniref:twin-arginine translocase TatA/TatE family subunit n=1 Tax=Pullulanibacillus sp. KACC 23026 TaxID=3028315 RepID=UPI0023B013DA|nr:twin-arginine translocase TatA/TatE family subunit [Pullulanibacillus sp. KACC 23026]WEG10903.1 twin-arginine translocase TatA/TatE family subunit [Pullulanibacillus sp. KACC 23026]
MESPGKIILVILLAFILFGAKKLPEFGSSAGKALFEFKKALNPGLDDSEVEKKSQPKEL